ncbi:MAG: tRNA-dihydrouridine synthase [Clostridium fessum]
MGALTGITVRSLHYGSSHKLTSRERNDILPEHNQGLCLIPQILTHSAEDFLWVCEELAEYGYRTVNLNLGCPSGTVVTKKKGAGFLAEPEDLSLFLEEVCNGLEKSTLRMESRCVCRSKPGSA